LCTSLVQGVLPYVVKSDYETELTEARNHWGFRATGGGGDDDDDVDDSIAYIVCFLSKLMVE
jgi:hypothetical protein